MSDIAVFLDRDGTLIHDPGYLNHPDQVQLIDGVAQALTEFQRLGYKTVVVSNQSGVARGIVTVEMLERIHDRLGELLAAQGAALDAIYYCPDHPDGVVPEYRKDSDWRKPQPGMLLAAAQEMDIDLTRSWMVGDTDRDIQAGRSAGCRTILIGAAHPEKSRPDYVAVNMREAVNIIKRHHRSTPADQHIAPGTGTSDEQGLAAKSTRILGMLEEHMTRASQEEAPAGAPPLPATTQTETDRLLTSILEHLRRMHKQEMFGEFSLMRLLAGLVQIFAVFCLLLALWFLLGSQRQDGNVFLALGFATALQVMALTFYLMHGRQ